MRRRDLLTQVLVVNLLLIVAAVVAAVIAANPDGSLGDTPEAGLVLGFAIALTIVLNAFLLQRRIKPLEDLVDRMERADLSRPGANLKLTETPAAWRRSRGCITRSSACWSGSRPSAAGPPAPPSTRRRRSGRGSRATCTTRSTSR